MTMNLKLIASWPLRGLILAVAATWLMSACSDSPAPAKPASAVVTPPALTVPAAAPAVKVLNWGPQFTKAGQGFAVQKSGNSAMWFEQRGVHSADSAEVWFDQTRLPGMAIKPNEGGSAEVPAELLAKPGRYPVYLKLLPGGERVDIGTFEVTP
jgi:hypothetical protein